MKGREVRRDPLRRGPRALAERLHERDVQQVDAAGERVQCRLELLVQAPAKCQHVIVVDAPPRTPHWTMLRAAGRRCVRRARRSVRGFIYQSPCGSLAHGLWEGLPMMIHRNAETTPRMPQVMTRGGQHGWT